MEVIDYNDVFLYAKGNYKKTNALKDLQKILSHVYDAEPEDIEREEVYRVLITLGMEHANSDSLFIDNLLEAFGLRWYSPCEIKEGEEENERLTKLLHILFQAHYIVKGEMVNNFGKANPKVLPLRVVEVIDLPLEGEDLTYFEEREKDEKVDPQSLCSTLGCMKPCATNKHLCNLHLQEFWTLMNL